ncbi:hypothetical protein AVEN_229920-1 [Araneus ventricosus]|uniref:Uncharacterized protein n=1 Tax=Araneus ventricosus TaxID=182803 RepID=A0A4Y2BYQ9_ARAVE|nr:hypothetical protein AVEN_229920-1 [Araneus ventricosus]
MPAVSDKGYTKISLFDYTLHLDNMYTRRVSQRLLKTINVHSSALFTAAAHGMASPFENTWRTYIADIYSGDGDSCSGCRVNIIYNILRKQLQLKMNVWSRFPSV